MAAARSIMVDRAKSRGGAFSKGFVGPSPPPGEVHTYEFTVRALGANGAPLATINARRKYPE